MNNTSLEQKSKLFFSYVVFFGRPLQVILTSMNIPNVNALKGLKILDCPGGPGSVSLELKQQGITAVAVDPLYSKSVEELEHDIQHSIDKVHQMLIADEKSGNIFLTNDFNINDYIESKRTTGKKFLADFIQGKKEGRYIVASLPQLPFEDNSFDIVWSAHLLFTYGSVASGGLDETGKLFPYEFHYNSIKEMLRVSKNQVLISPASKFFIPKVEANDLAKDVAKQLESEGHKVEFHETYIYSPHLYNNTSLVMQITKKK